MNRGSRSVGLAAKLAVARGIGSVSRLTGRGGGTTLPGRILLRAAPDAIRVLAERLERGSTIVSATNGKTTTAAMIAGALSAAGRTPVHNRAGSNMHWGVASALMERGGDEGLFEVDEGWLPRLAEDLEPRLIVLGNLFRDQLDRYGELEMLADSWQSVVEQRSGSTEFVLNADDPLIADLGRARDGSRRPGVTYFGIEDDRVALPELQHAFDAKHCRRCGAAYRHRRTFVGHLGWYECLSCGAERPRPDVSAIEIHLNGMSGSRVRLSTPAGEMDLSLPLPGLYNVYNALAAVAAGLRLGIDPDTVRTGLESMSAVFGRVETVRMGDGEVSILLVKNPAGANEVLRTIGLEEAPGEIDIWLALNDRIADGRDVSWIWDADFELLAGRVRTAVCAGNRAAEMALRLKYAGWPAERISVEERIDRSIDRAVAGASGRVFALPTYTALLELRRLISRRGLAPSYWS